jgi:GNAT superfamily N-acetyltransferase
MALVADRILDDVIARRRPPCSPSELDRQFRRLGLGLQLVLALERRLAREGARRRNPTDEQARLWFGFSGASSWRRWAARLRRG